MSKRWNAMRAEGVATLETPRLVTYKEVDRQPNMIDIRTFVSLLVLTAVIGIAVWGSLAKLDSATNGDGELRVESHRKTLKVLESGLVHRLLVAEGDHVLEGQPLIELDRSNADADAAIYRQRYYSTQAQLARYQAEAAGRTAVRFPDELLARADDPDVRAAMITEADLFDSRMSGLRARLELLESRRKQLQSQVESTDNQIASTREQIALSIDELESVEFLFKKNLIQKSRYLGVKRGHVDLVARLSEFQSRRAQIETEIGTIDLDLLDAQEQARKEALTQVSVLQSLLLELEQQVGRAANKVGLFTLRAPLSGTIVKLDVYSEGIVVLAGEPLMDIVPDNDELVVETKIDPDDIDNVSVGMEAKVRISAFNTRTTPLLTGKVTLVTADVVSPPGKEEKYYIALVTLGEDQVKRLNGLELAAGMKATVLIVKGERTVLDYLLSPLTVMAETAMREP